ncbi:uncharacterized protein LOC118433480 [Folsomia candida]|nr:uncharacterized protein LOC118433480 [Folsomia candida]
MINSTSGDGRVLKEFPISCCSWYHGKEVGNDGVPGAATKKKLDSAQTHCIIELGRISTTRAAANLSATYVEYDWETKVYNNSGVEGPNFPIFFNEDKRPMVHTNGCLTVIVQQHLSAVEAHESFFVILIIASVFMLMVYVKSWCDGRHFSGSGSEHSLDVENMSVIDIPRLSQGNSGGGGDRPSSGVVASGVRRMSAEARRMSDGLTTGIVGITRNSFSHGSGNPGSRGIGGSVMVPPTAGLKKGLLRK